MPHYTFQSSRVRRNVMGMRLLICPLLYPISSFLVFDSDIGFLVDFDILPEAQKVHFKMRFFYGLQIVIAVDGHSLRYMLR